MRYNLKTLTKLLLLLLILAVAVIVVILVGKGLILLWEGITYIVPKIWPYLCAAAAGVLLALTYKWWGRLLSKLKRRKKVRPQQRGEKQKGKRIWLVILPLLALILLISLLWRSCGSEEKQQAVQVYELSFDNVIIGRAYLDGVQKEVPNECPRALVGFKFINDQPVKDYNFYGMTYDEAVFVVSQDWKPLVVDNLSPAIVLSRQQMAVVTLAAMRMGKYGFLRSTFLEKINDGNLEEAGEWLLLQDAKGEIRKTGSEPKQYFYMLRLLWENEITINELLDMPMFSYKAVSVDKMYDQSGKYIFNEEIRKELKKGSFQTPRKALEL